MRAYFSTYDETINITIEDDDIGSDLLDDIVSLIAEKAVHELNSNIDGDTALELCELAAEIKNARAKCGDYLLKKAAEKEAEDE